MDERQIEQLIKEAIANALAPVEARLATVERQLDAALTEIKIQKEGRDI